MLNRVSIAVAAAALVFAYVGSASADCAGHQKTVTIPTVTAQGTTAPATPAPQTPVPQTGG